MGEQFHLWSGLDADGDFPPIGHLTATARWVGKTTTVGRGSATTTGAWAPYHYGRWLWDTNYGWCWWPGVRFGPSILAAGAGWLLRIRNRVLATSVGFRWHHMSRSIPGGAAGFMADTAVAGTNAGFAPKRNLTVAYRNARSTTTRLREWRPANSGRGVGQRSDDDPHFAWRADEYRHGSRGATDWSRPFQLARRRSDAALELLARLGARADSSVRVRPIR